MKKYDKYKNSGVEWLGSIPESWELKKLKIIASIYNGDSLNESKKSKFESEDENHLAYISSKDIDLDSSTITYENGLRIPIGEAKYKVAKNGSSLICIEGGSAGRKIAFTNQEVCFVNKLACIAAKNNINSKFIFYTLKGGLFQTQFKLAMSGMIGGVAISSINNFYILNPPIEEQTAISQFLDDKITKIDQAIAIKQKQIELLKERKILIYENAVTKGINSKVKLKPSGVRWLDSIPEHWEIVRSKRLFIQRKERARNTDEQLTASQKHGVIPQKLYMELEARKVTQVEFNSEILKHVEKGDFVISMRSFQGGIEYCSYTGCVSSAYVALIPTKHIEVNYYKYLLKSQRYINELSSTSNLVRDGQALRFDNFSQVDLIIIPIVEQREIAKYLDSISEKFSTSISLKEEEIEKLKEYKMSLIDGVVTGKVRVS